MVAVFTATTIIHYSLSKAPLCTFSLAAKAFFFLARKKNQKRAVAFGGVLVPFSLHLPAYKKETA